MTRTTRLMNTVIGPIVTGHRDPAAAWARAAEQVEKEEGAADQLFADDLARIVHGVADIPRLSPLGWAIVMGEVKGRYANRLRINRVMAENPRIADEPITAPLIVCGLPRTATTLAHRVLSMSPQHRAPLMWELTRTSLPDRRADEKIVKNLRRGVAMMYRLAPGLRDIHPIHPDRPEESIPTHGSAWEILHGRMSSYHHWLAGRDMTGDYAYVKQHLQILQHGREQRRWVLKYPAYLGDMATIQTVFPDATFVWTHRDPASIIGSTCSLVNTFWGVYQHDTDPREIGRFVLDHLVDQVQRGLEARLSMPPASIVDVPYHRLSADPFTAVPSLYAAIGATWTDSDRQHLADVVDRPKGTSSHAYDLSAYLDPDQVADAFAPYTRLLDRLDMRHAPRVVEL